MKTPHGLPQPFDVDAVTPRAQGYVDVRMTEAAWRRYVAYLELAEDLAEPGFVDIGAAAARARQLVIRKDGGK